MCLFQVGIGNGEVVHTTYFFSRLKKALITPNKDGDLGMGNVAVVNVYKTLCPQPVHFSPKALARKPVEASLSGHSSLVLLCLLAFSQEGHGGLTERCQHRPVERVGVRSASLVGIHYRCARPAFGGRCWQW